MPYKYETHLHTAVSSACAKVKGSEYLEHYVRLGYDGVFVTDHFYLGNTCVPRELRWRDWVGRYCESYRETLERGRELGIKVFFGWESTYGTGEDFLIYGLSPYWLESHPEIITLDQAGQYELVHAEGGAVIQAHPFREQWYMSEIRLHPWHCDAWEGVNGRNSAYQDRNAIKYAGIFGKKLTGGSDIHSLDSFEENAIIPLFTDEPLESAKDYARLLRSGSGWHVNLPEDRRTGETQKPGLDIYLYDRGNNESMLRFE